MEQFLPKMGQKKNVERPRPPRLARQEDYPGSFLAIAPQPQLYSYRGLVISVGENIAGQYHQRLNVEFLVFNSGFGSCGSSN